jgi:DNA-binding MarR family transcriptional regulator
MTSAKHSDSERLAAAWRELSASHARVCDALEHALQKRHKLSVSEFEVLDRLAEAPERKLRMQELADDAHLSQSALSRLVGRLETVGYVDRCICDYDRRGIWAQLTEEGTAARDEAAPTHREVLADTLRA